MSAPVSPFLDEVVAAARDRLGARGLPAPELLLLSATGLGELPELLRYGRELALSELGEVPAPWDESVLHAGFLGPLPVWLLEDRGDEPVAMGTCATPPWTGGFPLWLAAAAGCGLALHTSAGTLLAPLPGSAAAESAGERRPGAIAVVRDHLNASGASPLVGLGRSRLGPLFPDLSRLHHAGLRRAALERARRAGIPAFEAVAACTLGPALETPAERRMLAALGAEVAVQSLATPLLAAAHAGLAVLALVAVLDDGPAAPQLPELLETARQAEPRLAQLVLGLQDDLVQAARALRREDGAPLASESPRP